VEWSGTDRDETACDLVKRSAQSYSLEPVFLTPAEEAGYYRGFSNEILWPLCAQPAVAMRSQHQMIVMDPNEIILVLE
jgi:trehalose-6-phosphate synthase